MKAPYDVTLTQCDDGSIIARVGWPTVASGAERAVIGGESPNRYAPGEGRAANFGGGSFGGR